MLQCLRDQLSSGVGLRQIALHYPSAIWSVAAQPLGQDDGGVVRVVAVQYHSIAARVQLLCDYGADTAAGAIARAVGAKRLLMLTDRMVEGLREKGYRIISSRQPAEASGIVIAKGDDAARVGSVGPRE